MNAQQLLAKAAQCEDCGREHKPWRSQINVALAPQWSDRTDGHDYRPRVPLHVITKLQRLAQGAAS
jgi:hypothetical protein